jgi:hypothetical protein
MKGSSQRPRGESISQMSRRVDFSLGANSTASGNMEGDVYEDRERPRIPIEVQEASWSRERETEELRRSLEKSLRNSHGVTRASAREERLGPGHLNRVSTDSGSRWRGSTHRNRFLNRGRPGTGDEQGLMESGMADIPENPSTAGTGSSQPQSSERLDPRSGMISPRAWRMTTNESNIHPPQTQHGRVGSFDIANMPIAPEGHKSVGRSQTEDFEMRRFR